MEERGQTGGRDHGEIEGWAALMGQPTWPSVLNSGAVILKQLRVASCSQMAIINFLMSYAARNRGVWDRDAAEYQRRHGGQLAESGGAAWGVWQIPESELRVLGEVAGRDVLELGCGAAQWSIALHRFGARVTALDNSAGQLAYARVLMEASAADFPLVHASAEATGLADESFDIVFCDHGAMTFGDPYLTVPEAARLLRTGGLLAFSMHTPIVDIVWPSGSDHPSERLERDYWDLYAIDETGEGVAFQLRYGTWIRLFRENALAIEDLIELRPAADATSSYRDDFDREWARRWPMEHIWRVRKAPASRAREDSRAARPT
jgi:SAM-dependent methyltransferase